MVAMNSPASTTIVKSFAALLTEVERDFPAITFKRSASFYWAAEKQTVYHNSIDKNPVWSLLHELGHAICEHSTYQSDTRLVQMEVEAWDAAATLAPRYGYGIDPDYVQDCLDSYRNWQHARSRCPVCTQTGIETQSGDYHCINCQHRWHVSANRFCRVYRQTKKPSR